MADDWDLQAVVRGCTTTTTTSTSNTTTTTTTGAGAGGATTSTSTSGCGGDVYRRSFGSFELKQDGGNCLSFQDLFFEPRNIETTAASSSCGGIQELHDLYKPFFPKSSPPVSPQSIPISPLSVLSGLQDLSQQQNRQQLQQKHHRQIFQQPKQQTLSIGGSRTSAGASHNPSPRSKRRKNQMKRVCQVPAEALSSDMWSWRKYGQKPIKGSPYPRGYYRCSTSKGCLARKQVERNRSDPGMFIVTYTAEHNHPMPTHRNSLAGSTRQKPATTQTAGNSDDPNNKHASSSSSSPPVSPSASLSSPAPAPPLEKFEFDSSKDEEIMDDEEDDINAPEMTMMPLDDDFFDGLDELTEKSAGDCFPDHFPQSMQFPWLSNNATTTAAGGG